MDPGDSIAGRYRVTRVLGRGAFGITCAAEEIGTGTLVAVKQLDLRRVEDWKAVELFEREARVLASLDHPQIPNYVEFIPVADAHTGYLVQELAPGRSLAERLAAGERGSEPELRALATQLLDVLIYLSERLPPVVHRDIKPGNVIVADDGRVFLVDFGSVRDVVESSQTGGSTVAGTFGYMAPEQLHGEATPASDLYGLGMLLVHLMTGVEPSELERRRLKVDFRRHVDVSDELADFVDRLIEPVPDDRFATPREAQAALAGVRLAVRDPGPGLSADALAASVDAKARKAEELARKAKAVERERIAAVARKATPRIALVEDGEGFVVTAQPISLGLRFAQHLPFYLFALINPGFLFVGGFPFLGRFWPVFAEFWPGRVFVWFALLTGLSLYIAERRASTLHLRVAGDNFALWTKDPAKPEAIGALSELSVTASEPGANGYGVAYISGGDTTKILTRLAAPDLERIKRAAEQVQARQSR